MHCAGQDRTRGFSTRNLGIALVAAVMLVSGCAAPKSRVAAFDPAAFHDHVAFLAADDLEGRGLGTKGIDKAAEYIAQRFREYGLKPAGETGTYFQTFQVQLKPELTNDGYLIASGVDGELKRGEDYMPFQFSSVDEFDGEVVFAGYGITYEEKEYDDFVHLDVTDKVVLMFRGEPASWADENEVATPHAQFANKVYNARERGAAAVLIVDSKNEDGPSKGVLSWRSMAGRSSEADFGLPALHITRDLAGRLLAAGGAGTLDALRNTLDGGAFASRDLEGVRVKGKPGIQREQSPTRNVVGMLPGNGPLADEYVVIGAHYDHLGVTVPRTTHSNRDDAASAEPQIHNGADDNASGTAGVIELARIFSQRKPLQRSLVFMAFTGEESGLLGSKHFVNHPTLDLERMVVMLNMDMIGRLPEGSNKVQVFGTKAADELEEILNRLATKNGLEMRGSGSAFGPSDHTSFYTKKIPAVHFFTGLHTDYHLPSDDTEKINAEGAVQVLRYVYDTAHEIANTDTRLTYQHVAPLANTGRSSFRVRMGIMPSYVDSEEGMGVDGVLEGEPADLAQMKSGDVIIRIGESRVGNVYDYMSALSKFKPGDEVIVVVKRDGQEVELNVKLAGG